MHPGIGKGDREGRGENGGTGILRNGWGWRGTGHPYAFYVVHALGWSVCDSAEKFEYRNVVHRSLALLTCSPALSKGMNLNPVGLLGWGKSGVGVARQSLLSRAPKEFV